MRKIRKLNFFDRPKLKKIMSFMQSNGGTEFLDLMTNVFPGHLHYFLPLKYKFLNESYLLAEDKNVLGLITTNTFNGNPYKINITQLMFRENAYEDAQQMIEFIIAQYGALGAHTFFALIDERFTELGKVLTNTCGFRQCSSEQIWEVTKKRYKKPRSLTYRRFKNTDAKAVAEIYNDTLMTIYKPSLNRLDSEFCEGLCSGLKYQTEYRYVIEENSKIIGYFKITTPDNENYTVDFNYSNGYEIDFDNIMYLVKREIIKRQRHFKLFVKLKNYINTNDSQKTYFESKGFKCRSTKILLTKDFFKQVKVFSNEERFSLMGGLNNSPTFKIMDNE